MVRIKSKNLGIKKLTVETKLNDKAKFKGPKGKLVIS